MGFFSEYNALTPSRADAFLAAEVTGTLGSESEIKRATLRELMALVSDGISVMDRLYGAVGDGSTDDTAACAKAIASAAAWGVIRFPVGTYRLLNLTPTKPLILYTEAGAQLQLPASTTGGAAIIRAGSNDLVVLHAGRFYGQSTLQGTASTQRAVLSDGYHGIRVLGAGGRASLDGFTGRGIDLYNGNDNEIAYLRGSACSQEVFYMQRWTAGTIKRPHIHDVYADGYVAIEAVVTGAVAEHPRIERVYNNVVSTAEPGIEMWSINSGGIYHGRIVDCITSGPGGGGAAIGHSIARGTASLMINSQIFNFQTCAELADCDADSKVLGGVGDCKGISSSIAGIIDNSHNDGGRASFLGFTALNFTTAGIRFLNQDGFGLDGAAARGCTIHSPYDGVHGIDAIGKVLNGAATDNQITVPGSGCYGIILASTHAFTERNNDVAVGRLGTAVYVTLASGFSGQPGTFTALGSTCVAYALDAVQYFQAGGAGVLNGFVHDFQLISNSGRTDHGIVGDVYGGGGIEVTGASIGSDILVRPIGGWYPGGNLAFAEFYITDTGYANWYYKGGRVLGDGDPNTAWGGSPIPGKLGSTLSGASALYQKTAVSTWTAMT